MEDKKKNGKDWWYPDDKNPSAMANTANDGRSEIIGWKSLFESIVVAKPVNQVTVSMATPNHMIGDSLSNHNPWMRDADNPNPNTEKYASLWFLIIPSKTDD